ncbi:MULTISPECIES: BadF/BadG/BcrA/BcrD ATPase family protein [Inquilinus]|uniref:Glucosamine kinase n=1 Tax=Inquilinus ginsengisoli TaxID=363840 RepID=A0ABU1K005_9PROT|nr:BadF/BadG/BcrA/BcrD ATPase family protein [Inquilinus ginsengisoli]MDR6294197.1 glucosamine kinase [Inquilinus ginsengisoli]
MATRIHIGVDGGATGTRLRAVDPDGRILGEGTAGPSSLTLGVDAAWAQIRIALAAAGIAEADHPDTTVACGLAGTGRPEKRADFRAKAPGFARLRLCSDAHATTLGAHAGRPGAAIALGTGTVGSALFADGGTRQVGGWGFPVGDEGSGAWLGLKALGEALQLLDGRNVEPSGGSALHRAMYETCGATAPELLSWTYQAPSTKYATLAPIVVRLAEQGDPAAVRLMRAAGREVDRLARALDPDGVLPFCAGGSLAAPLRPYMDPAITARLRPPQGDARDGAVLLARSLAPGEAWSDA